MRLAEAKYAIWLIGTSKETTDTAGIYEAIVITAINEAWKLIDHLKKSADTDLAATGGPQSSATDVEPTFTRGKYDSDGNLLGNKMGIKDEKEGNLDDW